MLSKYKRSKNKINYSRQVHTLDYVCFQFGSESDADIYRPQVTGRVKITQMLIDHEFQVVMPTVYKQ